MKRFVKQQLKFKPVLALISILLAIATVIATVMTSRTAQAADDQPLNVLASAAADLTRHRPAAQILVQQNDDLRLASDSHPLNKYVVEANIKDSSSVKRILTYNQAHQSFNVYNEADEVYVVASYAYRYDDAQSAAAAAREIESQVTAFSRTKAQSVGNSSARTSKVSFIGKEGTLVTWIIAPWGKTLLLVMVEGKNDVSTQGVTDALVSSLPSE